MESSFKIVSGIVDPRRAIGQKYNKVAPQALDKQGGNQYSSGTAFKLEGKGNYGTAGHVKGDVFSVLKIQDGKVVGVGIGAGQTDYKPGGNSPDIKGVNVREFGDMNDKPVKDIGNAGQNIQIKSPVPNGQVQPSLKTELQGIGSVDKSGNNFGEQVKLSVSNLKDAAGSLLNKGIDSAKGLIDGAKRLMVNNPNGIMKPGASGAVALNEKGQAVGLVTEGNEKQAALTLLDKGNWASLQGYVQKAATKTDELFNSNPQLRGLQSLATA